VAQIIRGRQINRIAQRLAAAKAAAMNEPAQPAGELEVIRVTVSEIFKWANVLYEAQGNKFANENGDRIKVLCGKLHSQLAALQREEREK
jgi:hypothetical protein